MFDQTKEYVIVSATALESSGALTILRQFIEHASNDSHDFIIFVPSSLDLPEYKNIVYVKTSPKNWIKRIYWDWFGCGKFLKRESIKVKLVICLQNSSLNVPYQQIIYLHQPIPFSEFSLSLRNLTLNDLKLFLYKKFYALFIFKFINDQTIFVVQTEWMKLGVLKKCTGLNIEQVVVLKPDLKLASELINENLIHKNTLLYPATALSYKNHIVILKSLVILKEKYHINDIKFQVTFDKGMYKTFDRYISKYSLSDNIEYLGFISYSELQQRYHRVAVIVFPSYIESYGLPLIESASLGKQIVCSDLPYARDVLENYEGVSFVKYDDESHWAHSIYNALIIKSHTQIRPYENDTRSSWPHFFDLIQ
ncbi:glycosyltransferase [Kluyvera sp. EC_51]|uniref:glycosyltransferase n=1 Tax=Kluyvera sp. EC_51 TaxID=2584089 RepID=UPI001C700874|nr:glycosyltransferase [Kluyvera sp. EC_51]MBW9461107.1 glycosyltransferase [Kluyvera sp. EC_51]